MHIVIENTLLKAQSLAAARRAETAEAEADRLREVIRTAMSDLQDLDQVPWHDSRTTLRDWLAVQVQPRRPCPLLRLMAGERPVLPEAV